MARFPTKKRQRYRKAYDRSDADIIASKMMFDDLKRGISKPLSEYDKISDKLCGMKSRGIYKEVDE